MKSLNRLYYFYIFAKKKDVVTASKTLSISQPALSTQLKLLDEELGGDLFKRSGRRLLLSERGQELQVYCRKVFDLYEQLQMEMKHKKKNVAGHLRVGICDQIERPFAIHLISRVLNERPQLRENLIQVSSADHEEMIQKLRDQELDFVVSNQPFYHEDVRVQTQLEMPVVLIWERSLGKQVRGAHAGDIRQVRDLVESLGGRFAMPSPRLRLRLETDQFLEKAKVSPTIGFEADLVASVVRSVTDGIGIGLLPLPYVEQYMASKKVRTFGPKKGFWTHSIWLMTRARMSAEIELISETFKEVFTDVSSNLFEDNM